MKKRVVINVPETHGQSLCCKSRKMCLSDKRTACHNDTQRRQDENKKNYQEDYCGWNGFFFKMYWDIIYLLFFVIP